MAQMLQLAESDQVVRVEPGAVLETDGVQIGHVRIDAREEGARHLGRVRADAVEGERFEGGGEVEDAQLLELDKGEERSACIQLAIVCSTSALTSLVSRNAENSANSRSCGHFACSRRSMLFVMVTLS